MAASAGRIAALLALLAASAAWAASDPRFAPEPRRAPATSWDVRFGAEGDPGEPFELTGTVREANGEPARGRKIFVYHADNRGVYAEPNRPMRYAGTLRTDEQGRYRIRTIFPGGYGGFAAHVHYEILEPVRRAGVFNVRPEGRQGQGLVAKRGRDGVWRLEIDLRPGASPG